MTINSIALAHVIWTFIVPLYPLFITSRSKLDIYFMVYILLLNLSWTLLNGECFITLYSLATTDTKIKVKRDPTNMVDFYQVLPKELYDNFLFYILIGAQTAATWIVFSRNQDIIGLGWTFALIVASLGYLYVLRTNSPNLMIVYTEAYKLALVWVIAQGLEKMKRA